MKKLVFILFAMLFAVGCESVRFKHIALYDKYEEAPQAEKVPKIIYDDAVGTMWNSLENCGEFEITNEAAYSGKSSIKISWDKNKGCEWMGFGNSFNNWAAADLSEDRFKKALSFYVRTQSNTAKAIPIVANLEDFSGGGSYYFIDAGKYLTALEMDTTWKQIIVPLWDFPVDADEVDIYAIKQMKFQLESSGAFFLDDIRLIDYSKADYAEMREKVELMKPKGKMEQIVYRKGKLIEDAWGNENNRCQVLEERTASSADPYIYWKFETENCDWAKWGLNWNGWYQINLRGITEQSKLKFRFKTDGKARFKLVLEDFRGHSAEVFATGDKYAGNSDWQQIEVPLKSLQLSEKKFVMDQIRQLRFDGLASGEVMLKDIRITGS